MITTICTKETTHFKKGEKYLAEVFDANITYYYKVYFDPNNPHGFTIFYMNFTNFKTTQSEQPFLYFSDHFMNLDEWRNLKLNELGI